MSVAVFPLREVLMRRLTMSKFTPGRWSIAPPIFDGDAIFAPPQEKGRRNEVVAM